MDFENPVRLDISHSKTLHVISIVSSVTTVEEARYKLNTQVPYRFNYVYIEAV